MTILPIYAALLVLLFVALSVRTVRVRRRLKIAIGDAGDREMLRAVRVHSNFAEYVPLALLAIYLVEVGGAPALLVHALGGGLLLGRVLHAVGVSRQREQFQYRVAGMLLTFAVLVVAAGTLLVTSLG